MLRFNYSAAARKRSMIPVSALDQAYRNNVAPPPRGSVNSRPASQTLALDHGNDISAIPGLIVHAERGVEIIAQGEWASHCFEVLSGCVRTVQILEDGRRHIGEFILPGEVYGLNFQTRHDFSAQTIGNCQIRLVAACDVEEMACQNLEFASFLRQHLSVELQTARARQVVLARKTGAERLAAFLLEMSERIDASHGLHLPMSRIDIADHLGLAFETVERLFAELRRLGIVAFDRTILHIFDAEALFRADFGPVMLPNRESPVGQGRAA